MLEHTQLLQFIGISLTLLNSVSKIVKNVQAKRVGVMPSLHFVRYKTCSHQRSLSHPHSRTHNCASFVVRACLICSAAEIDSSFAYYL